MFAFFAPLCLSDEIDPPPDVWGHGFCFCQFPFITFHFYVYLFIAIKPKHPGEGNGQEIWRKSLRKNYNAIQRGVKPALSSTLNALAISTNFERVYTSSDQRWIFLSEKTSFVT